MVGGERGLELALVEREQRLGRAARRRLAAATRRRYSSRADALQLGEALEAERLREAHDGRARGVRAARELLGRLEGDLVEVVDDVLRDVLLGARELVEARLDVGRQGLVAAASGGAAGVVVVAALFMGDPLFDGAVQRSSQATPGRRR